MTDNITFVIASYNDELIGKTIESIIEVAEDRDEIIVVDGKSSDKTVNIARNALKYFPSSKIISEPDSGVYDAWNKALKIGSGQWFSFIGCGDLLNPEYRKWMLNNVPKGITLVHAKARFYDEIDNKVIELGVFGKEFNKKEFTKKMKICQAGALHHFTLFENSRFSTEYKVISDYHFLLKQIDLINALFINREVIRMKVGGISTRNALALREKFLMNCKEPNNNKVLLAIDAMLSIIIFYLSKIYRKFF